MSERSATVTRNPDAVFGQSLRGRGFGVDGAGAPPPPAPRIPRTLREGEVDLGRVANGDVIGLHLGKLIEGRLLIQGNSGAGKSMLLRRLFEQCFGRIQQLLVDPDGEFSTLAEKFDVTVLTSTDALRVGGRALALHLREHRYSAVLDLSDATSEQRLTIVADLAGGLIDAPAEHWHPLLVLADEVQTLAPYYDTGDVETETRKRAIAALADMMGRGRKRGVAGVIATMRLAETAKAVVSKATNIIVGRTIFDRDLERAGALLGYTVGHSRTLRGLSDGEFLCLGPASAGPSRVRFKAGPVVSRHKGEAPKVTAPPTITAAAALAMLRQVPQQVAAPVEQPIVHGSQTGRRRLDWRQDWDAVIRAGYAEGKLISAISADLVAVGLSVSVSTISTRAHALGLVSEKAIRGWAEEEDQILADAYAREVRIFDIAGLLAAKGYTRGRVAIQMRAIALGITRDRVNYWTEPEKKIALTGLAAGKTNREIIAELKAAGYDRGLTSVSKFAQKNNIDRSHDGWSDADTRKLQELYSTTSVQKLMQMFDKTRGAVAAMASKLGLRQRQPWTDEEKAVLVRAQRDGKKLIDIPALLPGRTYATVARMAGQLRLDFSQNRPKEKPDGKPHPRRTVAAVDRRQRKRPKSKSRR
jgi:hypothetical protein